MILLLSYQRLKIQIFLQSGVSLKKKIMSYLFQVSQLQKSKKCNLVIFGQGPLLLSLQALAKKLGVNGRVHFMGFIDYLPIF